ncbi:hypothetical protein RRG08_020679 [Elysia crispata]|uniref:Uncharacterized protein n=1 Tax=Elysia crispata TaxID=231223 RepID=A0AAE1DAC2_9GAST|nr:hypothetical protein RRG08_020679 [Elysia crispata]
MASTYELDMPLCPEKLRTLRNLLVKGRLLLELGLTLQSLIGLCWDSQCTVRQLSSKRFTRRTRTEPTSVSFYSPCEFLTASALKDHATANRKSCVNTIGDETNRGDKHYCWSVWPIWPDITDRCRGQ